jgi:hypothetical protein
MMSQIGNASSSMGFITMPGKEFVDTSHSNFNRDRGLLLSTIRREDGVALSTGLNKLGCNVTVEFSFRQVKGKQCRTKELLSDSIHCSAAREEKRHRFRAGLIEIVHEMQQ